MIWPNMFAFGQTDGKVISKTKESIPYANIIEVNRSFGVAADMHGRFELQQPKSILDTCFLKISALGYRDTIIHASSLYQDCVVILTKASLLLQEVSITSGKGNSYCLGVDRKCIVLCGGWPGVYPGQQYGLFIKSSIDGIKVNSIEVYIKKEGSPTSPFRIRIYAFDSITELPGNDILTKQYIGRAKKGNEWVSINIKNENIFIPKQGIVVAVEWIFTNDKYYYSNDDAGHNYYGVVIGQGNKSKLPSVYRKKFETGWVKVSFPQSIKKFPRPAIRLNCSD